MKKLDENDIPEHKSLSVTQLKAAVLLAAGVSGRRTARTLGTSTRSVFAWLRDPAFLEQKNALSAVFMAEYQADVLNRLKETPRYLSEIIENPKEKATDRIAAIASLRDTAINWYVVRPLEEARQRMEAGRDATEPCDEINAVTKRG